MISYKEMKKMTVFEICLNSEEIKAGDTFNGCVLAVDGCYSPPPNDGIIICCGRITENEMLFCTEDGRIFFSLRDYWGKRDGILYGKESVSYYDFKRSTLPENIVEECEAERGTYNSWACALAWKRRGEFLDSVIAVMKRETSGKEE